MDYKTVYLENYVGCDEVGVGDYFGGIVCCACYLPAESEEELIKIGIKDSKKIIDKKIESLFFELKKYVKYACLYIEPSKYNDLVSKFHNTHIVKTLLHDKAIKLLFAKNKLKSNTQVVLDQYAPEKNYYDYFKIIGVEPHKVDIFETKAENKYLAVAAASVIARYEFLKQINLLRKQSNINFLLGASSPTIIEDAKKIYLRGDKEELYKYVKIDFSLTKKVIE